MSNDFSTPNSPRHPAVTVALSPASQGVMLTAVEETLAALSLTSADAAAVRLARSLAEAIDADTRQGVTLSELSSKLLAVLTALGATPAARARVKDGGAPGGGANVLDELRARRKA